MTEGGRRRPDWGSRMPAGGEGVTARVRQGGGSGERRQGEEGWSGRTRGRRVRHPPPFPTVGRDRTPYGHQRHRPSARRPDAPIKSPRHPPNPTAAGERTVMLSSVCSTGVSWGSGERG